MSTRRYPAYKDSGVEWLGEVPVGWGVEPLWANSSCNDEVLPETTPPNYEFEYVEISDVSQVEGVGTGVTVSFADAPSRARRIARGSDVLVSTVRTYLRAIAAVPSERDSVVASTGFAVFRSRSLSPTFLVYLFHAEYLVAEIISRSTGVSYPAINASTIQKLKIPVPSIAEQNAIATFLDRETAKIDALIAEQERLIALLQEKRQAVISQAVTKGLDPTVPMKDSGVEWLGMVPEHWDTYGFLRGFNVVYRYPTYFDISYEQSGIPEIRGEAIGLDGQIVELDDMRFISPKTNSKFPMTQLALNDLVMSVRGTLGKIGLVDEKFVGANITANLLRLSPDPSLVRAEFLVWLMRAELFTIQLDLVSSQTTIKTVTVPQLGQIKIPVPSLQEQKDITTFLKHECQKMEGLKEEANKAITLLRERRAALISAAVTGKIDVRAAGAAAQEAA